MKDLLLRPTEILELNNVTDLTARDVGNLFRVGAVKGIKTVVGCQVTDKSFKKFLEFRKTVQNSTVTI